MGLVVSHLAIGRLRDKICELTYTYCALLERGIVRTINTAKSDLNTAERSFPLVD